MRLRNPIISDSDFGRKDTSGNIGNILWYFYRKFNHVINRNIGCFSHYDTTNSINKGIAVYCFGIGNGKVYRSIFIFLERMVEMKATQEEKMEYEQYIKQVTPTHSTVKNAYRAFITGGGICLLGEFLNQVFQKNGLQKEQAAAWTLIILIGAAVILTGFNLFSKLAKFGGAGVLVPITGFANSVVAPAIEYKKEGQVFGIGVKIFTISGPVILYGIVASWLLGVGYYILILTGMISGGAS